MVILDDIQDKIILILKDSTQPITTYEITKLILANKDADHKTFERTRTKINYDMVKLVEQGRVKQSKLKNANLYKIV